MKLIFPALLSLGALGKCGYLGGVRPSQVGIVSAPRLAGATVTAPRLAGTERLQRGGSRSRAGARPPAHPPTRLGRSGGRAPLRPPLAWTCTELPEGRPRP